MPRDARETLNGVRVTVRGTMMQDNLPRKRRRRERPVRIGGMAGEGHRLTDLPLRRRDGASINAAGGVPDIDQDVGLRSAMIVGHSEPHGVNFRLRVGEGGLGDRGIAEGSVAVEVP